MTLLVTILCIIFCLYGAQCSTLYTDLATLLKYLLSDWLILIANQFSALNATWYDGEAIFRQGNENISAFANEVLLSYEEDLLAILAAVPLGLCIPPNSSLIEAVQKFQNQSLECTGNVSNILYHEIYETIFLKNLNYQATVDALLAELLACGGLLFDLCVTTVQTKIIALLSDPGFIVALAPNLASDLLHGFLTDIDNCLNTSLLSEAITLSDENIAYARACVAELLTGIP